MFTTYEKSENYFPFLFVSPPTGLLRCAEFIVVLACVDWCLCLFLKIEPLSWSSCLRSAFPCLYCEVHLTEDNQIIIAVIIYYSSVIKNNWFDQYFMILAFWLDIMRLMICMSLERFSKLFYWWCEGLCETCWGCIQKRRRFQLMLIQLLLMIFYNKVCVVWKVHLQWRKVLALV